MHGYMWVLKLIIYSLDRIWLRNYPIIVFVIFRVSSIKKIFSNKNDTRYRNKYYNKVISLFHRKNEADLKFKKRFSDQFKYEFQSRANYRLPNIGVRIKKLPTLKNHR